MEVKFTEEQQAVIDARDCNVLVSAAAGSGKTAVLVERIIQMICSDLDVDHLLVVTFTKAAASQMKEKITAAIQKRLSMEPENAHLQRQETLIHNAQITTIDSFCQYVIRNDFSAIGLDPSFRVADTGELKLIREDVMLELLENEYEATSDDPESDFLYCMEYFSTGSSDRKVESYISQLYDFSMSMPFPEDWIRDRAGDYDIEGTDFEELPWVKECVQTAIRTIRECVSKMDLAISVCNESDGPSMYGDCIEKDKASIYAALRYDTYNALFDGVRGISFGRLSSKKDDSVNKDKRDYVKSLRDEVKKSVDELKEKYFALTPETIVAQMKLCGRAVKELCRLTLKFKELFDEKKRSQQIIDFSDMEHFALQILVNHPTMEECEGMSCEEILSACTPSATAMEYRDYYREVLIDEYQDSNNVQEMILKAISGEVADTSERFMVGDVKQSIYKFRLARPEIFMEKLRGYDKAKDAKDRRIDLHKNFRSRSQVLDITNYIFRRIMGDDLGGVDYDKDAELICGASYDEPLFNVTPELILLDGSSVLEGDEADEYISDLNDREKEALLIAERIHQLRQENKGLMFKDIVILLRSLSGWDSVFKEVLEDQGIPTYIDSKSGYYDSPEVAVLLAMLSVIDNPTQDIPLVSVMHSELGGFSDEELALIRIAIDGAHEDNLSDSFYEGMCGTLDLPDELSGKVESFVRMIEELRDLSTYTPVHELLQLIIDRTDFEMVVSSQPSGSQRRANVEMLLDQAANFEKTSFKGLFHFVRYIEHIRVAMVDYGEAGTIDENADVVRIMSIHKSKGLEFPVVFVSGISKAFNKMDLRGDLVCDMDLGIGTKCINTELRVKYDTLKRLMITDKMNDDNLGEELRVLYVALTRAKEKLILTAYVKDLVKELAAELKKLPLITGGDRVMPFSLRHSAGNYFNLVLRALIPHPGMKDVLSRYELDLTDFEKHQAKEKDAPGLKVIALGEKELKENLVLGQVHALLKKEELRSVIESAVSGGEEYYDEELGERLIARFTSKYAYENLKGLFTKTSVSELKKKAYEEEEISETKAAFVVEAEAAVDEGMRDLTEGKENCSADKTDEGESASQDSEADTVKKHFTGADRGTAFHRVMELLDKEIYGDEGLMKAAREECGDEGEGKPGRASLYIRDWIKKKSEEGLMDPDTPYMVWTPDVTAFLSSDMGQRMGAAFRAGKLMREKPFMMGISAAELDPGFPEEEMVIIQGIIDAFFIENDEVVLLDYKTDKVPDPETLIKRYKVQIELYRRAIESATGFKVKESYLYSVALKRAILV